MPASEPPQRDSREIAEALERALEELRREFQERLRQTREEIEGLIGRSPEEAATAVEGLAGEGERPTEGAPAGEGERPEPPAPAVGALDAVRAIDRARSQAAILSALLDAAEGMAPRTALVLVSNAGFRCWEARGFEPDADATVALWEADGWRRLAGGRGCVGLAAEDVAALAGAAEDGERGERGGVAVPLVLHDRLAAALFAELPAGGAGAEILQLLTFVAAQAIETLPFRTRAITPTLRHEDEAEAHEPGLPLWRAGAAEAAPASAELEEPEPDPRTEELPQEAAGEGAIEPSEPEAFGLQLDSEEPEPEADEVEVSPAPREEDDTRVAASRLEAEAGAPREAAGEPAGEAEPAFAGAAEPDAAAPPLDAGEPPAMEVSAEPQPEEPGPAEPAPEEPAPEEPAGQEAGEPVAAPTTEEEVEGAERTAEGAAEAAPPAPEETGEAGADEAAAPAPAAAPAGFQVQPPTDVRGPGRAFSQERGAASGQGAHDEARRLARLLVSEIKLYNEDEVQRGRRESRILELLGEEIERSREVYEERVDDEVRAAHDYFGDELIRILAGGDPAALGD